MKKAGKDIQCSQAPPYVDTRVAQPVTNPRLRNYNLFHRHRYRSLSAVLG